MSKITRVVRDLNAVLPTLQTNVDRAVVRERLRYFDKTNLLDAARTAQTYLNELVEEVERAVNRENNRAPRKVKTKSGVAVSANTVTTPNSTQADTQFFVSNTSGLTTFKGETAVNVVVKTPTTLFGHEPLEYTLATGDAVKISRFARGSRTNLGTGYSTIPVLNRFLINSTQPLLNKLAT